MLRCKIQEKTKKGVTLPFVQDAGSAEGGGSDATVWGGCGQPERGGTQQTQGTPRPW